MQSPLLEPAIQLFTRNYSGTPDIMAYAPGRVNLIGEHTDYNDGFVCPFAIELHTIVVGRKIDGNICYVSTTAQNVPNQTQSFPGDKTLVPVDTRDWSNYVKGVVASYRDEYKLPSIAFEMVISSNVPMGGGLSSSASLEVAVATFIEKAYNLPVDKVSRALLCQRAEHTFAHVQCGIMDQFISSCGKQGYALLIDCRSKVTIDVPLTNPNIAFIICNSNKNHELSDGGYVSRVKQCQQAVEILQTINPKIVKLRDATLEELEQVKNKMDDVVYRRAKHSISEDLRTQKCLKALQDNDYETVGRLMYESHESLDSNYNVSTDELNTLVKIARNLNGVYGSRMTGGGFGGCTITLCRLSEANNIMNEITQQYKSLTGIDCSIFITKPGNGAYIIDNNNINKNKNSNNNNSCCSGSNSSGSNDKCNKDGCCCPCGFVKQNKTIILMSLLSVVAYFGYKMYRKHH